MKNCLVTTFKASANNPDLPIFEEMQQFTLDAIVASGNSSMTDEQKWELNHFFYSLGKFSNGDTIWSKIDLLFLPLIAGSIDTCTIDYLNNQDQMYGNRNRITYSDKGILAASTLSLIVKKAATKNLSSKNVSFVMAFSNETKKNNRSISLLDNSADKIFYRSNPYSSAQTNKYFGFYCDSGTGYYIRADAKPSVINCVNAKNFDGSTNQGVSAFSLQGDTITPASIQVVSDNYTEETYSVQKNIGVWVSPSTDNAPLQVAICSEGLTATEAQIVTNAVNELRNSFI